MSDARPSAIVAEDEAIASMALRAQLEALGYDVIGIARDGDDAITLGRCFPVDVAVFDHRMPRRTGIEAATELFGLAPTPVVLLTGFSSADLPDPMPRPPIFATLTKPIGLADLEAGLARARDAFAAWTADDAEAREAADRSRDERTLIARTVRHEAADGDLLAAAAAFVRRARDQDRPLIDLARRDPPS